jgi:hypothetical protein
MSLDAATAPARAIGELGQTIEAQADRYQMLQAEDRYTKLRDWQLNALNGQNGLLTLQGAASVNGPKVGDAMTSFEEAQKQIGDGLSGRAAQYYQQRAAATALQFKEQVLRHQATQATAWAGQVTDSAINSEIGQIQANYANENLIAASLTRMNAMIDQHASDPSVGWSAGQTSQFKSQVLDRALTARYTAWSLDDPVGALKSFEASKEAVRDPATRTRVMTQLKSMAYPVQGQQIAEEALASATKKVMLTGEGVGEQGVPGVPGFKGDPVDVANDISRLLSMGKAEDAAALAEQVKKQMEAPGGTVVVPMTGKTDVMAQYGNMLSFVHKAAGGDAILEQHAMQSLHSQLSDIVRTQDGILKHNYDSVLGEVKFDGSPGPTSVSQLSPAARVAYTQLPPEQQRGVAGALREAAAIQRGEYKQSDPTTFNSLLSRIYLPEGSPDRIRTRADLVPYQQDGSISFADFNHLSQQIDYAQTPEGSVFGRQMTTVKSNARAQLLRNMMNMINPGAAEEASYRFSVALDKRVQQMRAEGKDPSILFDPGTQERPNPLYVLDPSYVQSFMGTPRGALQSAASKAREQGGEAGTGRFPAPAEEGQAQPTKPTGYQPTLPQYPRAENPKTGEIMIYKDGKWQKP